MRFILLIVALVFISPGCGLRDREEQLEIKEAALKEKEQELLLKDKTLLLKEEELLLKEKKTLEDSIYQIEKLFRDTLVGNWRVQMVCTETTCSGSALGDTKNEQWVFSYEGNNIIAKAMSENKIVRVYTGIYTGNTIELVEEHDRDPASTTKMVVRLRITSPTQMQGQREINRPNCKVLYDLQLDKISKP